MVDDPLGPVSGAFPAAKHLVSPQTEDWALSPEALAGLGTLLANAQKVRNTLLSPQRVYVGRYGHSGRPRTTLSSDTDLRMGEATLL
jgi:hypothetical protein